MKERIAVGELVGIEVGVGGVGVVGVVLEPQSVDPAVKLEVEPETTLAKLKPNPVKQDAEGNPRFAVIVTA